MVVTGSIHLREGRGDAFRVSATLAAGVGSASKGRPEFPSPVPYSLLTAHLLSLSLPHAGPVGSTARCVRTCSTVIPLDGPRARCTSSAVFAISDVPPRCGRYIKALHSARQKLAAADASQLQSAEAALATAQTAHSQMTRRLAAIGLFIQLLRPYRWTEEDAERQKHLVRWVEQQIPRLESGCRMRQRGGTGDAEDDVGVGMEQGVSAVDGPGLEGACCAKTI